MIRANRDILSDFNNSNLKIDLRLKNKEKER